MERIEGKVVLITGAGRGIGAATARMFAAAGAHVGLAVRDPDAAAALAEETGGVILPCDVAQAADLERAVASLYERFGKLDVLINNAGVIDPIAGIAVADPVAWGRCMDINIKGVFHGIRAALPVMRAQGGGTIITVGSGAAHNPQEGWSAYCTSKAAAWMLTRATDQEARADGIRVFSLSPGTVATDMQAAIRQSGVNPVSQLDWSVHIPADWPAQALMWMCTPAADDYLGQEVSLRDEAIRRALGLGSR